MSIIENDELSADCTARVVSSRFCTRLLCNVQLGATADPFFMIFTFWFFVQRRLRSLRFWDFASLRRLAVEGVADWLPRFAWPESHAEKI
jgi:hypothetical protein